MHGTSTHPGMSRCFLACVLFPRRVCRRHCILAGPAWKSGAANGGGWLQVTCTLVPHGVQVVDVTSSTCVLSWGLKGRTPLLPAAVVGAGERLVLACEDGAVLSWRAKETTDLAKADVLKGKSRAAKLQMLLVEPSLDAILLVYTDGHVSCPGPSTPLRVHSRCDRPHCT